MESKHGFQKGTNNYYGHPACVVFSKKKKTILVSEGALAGVLQDSYSVMASCFSLH